MTKQEALELMLNSLNQDNRDMCERSGMDKDQAEKMMAESQISLQFMVNNMYDRMQAANILKD